MKALEKILKSVKCIVFLDLEGTQYSHEIIEIGAIKTYINPDCTIRRQFKEFHSFIKPKEKVGKYVTELTGITDEQLTKEGIPFPQAINAFKKYLGKDFKGCLFLTYGSSDAAMFHYSILANKDYEGTDAKWIAKRCFDFSSFLKTYITSQNGECLSLVNILNVFNSPFEGHHHGAVADAKNLQILYKLFLSHPEIVEAEYKKTLSRKNNYPGPVQKVMNALRAGKTVTPELYDEIIKETLK